MTDDLADLPTSAVAPKGNKAERTEPCGAQIEAGNVVLVKAGWNRAFLDEDRAFPTGTHADQVDAASGAFGELTASGWGEAIARAFGG